MMLLFDTINIMASESLGGMRMKYSIAICDDSKTDAALVQSFLLEWAKQRGTEVEIEVFPSAESFLFRYDEYKAFDILLFDVEMSGMVCRRRVRFAAKMKLFKSCSSPAIRIILPRAMMLPRCIIS